MFIKDYIECYTKQENLCHWDPSVQQRLSDKTFKFSYLVIGGVQSSSLSSGLGLTRWIYDPALPVPFRITLGTSP